MRDTSISPEMRAWLEREKLEALAEFAAGAGHEINNPVATIVGRAQLLLAGETDPDRRQQLLTIVAQALRIRDMIGDAMLFARPPAPAFAPCDLTAIVREESGRLREAAALRETTLELRLADAAPILADRGQIVVVLHALVRNSLEALRAGGTVAIVVENDSPRDDTASAADAAADSSAVAGMNAPRTSILRVRDDGPGLSDVDRRHLFDPFYSGRQAGRGLGFGLPKCQRIVTLHGGTIDVASQSECTEFVVRLPAADAVSVPRP